MRIELASADADVSLASNATRRLEPKSTYRVTFWAKVASGKGYVRLNFYRGADYDFPQVGVDLESDGDWHRYEVVLETGEFPASVHPALRVWGIARAQRVYIDDVAIEPAGGGAVRPAPSVHVGAMETL